MYFFVISQCLITNSLPLMPQPLSLSAGMRTDNGECELSVMLKFNPIPTWIICCLLVQELLLLYFPQFEILQVSPLFLAVHFHHFTLESHIQILRDALHQFESLYLNAFCVFSSAKPIKFALTVLLAQVFRGTYTNSFDRYAPLTMLNR